MARKRPEAPFAVIGGSTAYEFLNSGAIKGERLDRIEWVNASKADQAIAVSSYVLGNEVIGDLCLQVSAAKSQHDSFVDRLTCAEVLFRAGIRNALAIARVQRPRGGS